MTTPYQAIMGGFNASQNAMSSSPSVMPNAGFGGIFGRMQQLANTLQNPQQLISRYFPDAPAEVSGNPEQLLEWMQQTGKVNPQMVQMARQMVGR